MSNGTGRKRTLGIATEATYGVQASSPTFVLPILDTPRVEIMQNKEDNIASLGSTYNANQVVNTNRQSNVSVPVKVDEDQLPIFFKQKFTITSTTASGETAVYQHTLAYNSNNNGTSYTLFLEDGDRTSQVITGVRFSDLNLTAESGFLKLDLSGIGKYPTTWTGTNTVVQPKDFVGRNVALQFAEYTASLSTISALSAVLNHTFALSGDDLNFALGSQDLTSLFTTEDTFTNEIKMLFSDFTYRDLFEGNDRVKWTITAQDTGRYVTGSVASTNPYIQFSYPVGYIKNWVEEGGASDILTQTLTLMPVDEIGVSTAPLQIVVKNAISSY